MRYRRVATLVLAATLAGCALAPYGASVDGGPGYVDRKLGEGVYQVTLFGKTLGAGDVAPRSRERQLRQNVHRRAEELCGNTTYQLDGYRQTDEPRRGEKGMLKVMQITTRVICRPQG
jgi:hypothetical protein